MRLRHRSRLLAGLGVLLALCTAGCQGLEWTSFRDGGLSRAFARLHSGPASPSAEIVRPQRSSEYAAATRQHPAAAMEPPIIRTSHEEVGGAVEASSWRSLGRPPEALETGKLDLSPAPQQTTSPSPYHLLGMERLHLPRKVASPRQGETIVLASQASLPGKVMKNAVPAMHPGGPFGHHGFAVGEVPHEGHLVPQPPYIISPPDMLLIRMIRPRQVPDEAPQIIDGEHLVRPDGSVNVGVYGSAFVAGMTIDAAREVIAELISRRIKYKGMTKDTPKAERVEEVMKELVVDVVAYRSKFYYVIADGGGPGEQVVPILVTGNDTVLDAVGKVGGLPPQAAKKKIWVARANCPPNQPHQLLPVEWKDITMRGQQTTNYQLFPGDRLYVNSDPRLRFYTQLDRTLDPFDRAAGSIILGAAMVRSVRGFGGGTGSSSGLNAGSR